MRIGLLNAYSKANVGDWLLLVNSSELANLTFPNSDQQVVAMDPLSFQGVDSRMTIQPSPVEPKRVLATAAAVAVALLTNGRRGPHHLRSLRHLDAAFSIGGGFLQMRDVREMLTVSLIHLSQLAICRQARVPLVMLPQSVGPFHGRLQRAVGRAVLGWFRLILVREQRSAEHVRRLAPQLADRVRVVPDLAFLSTPLDALPSQSPKGSLRIGIVARQWWFPGSGDPHAAEERYLGQIADLADRLHQAGHRPVLVVHSDGPTSRGDDRVSTRRIHDLADTPLDVMDVARRNTISDVIDTYSAFDAVISTRLHGALLALIAGVPAIAIGYEWKTEGIFAELGLEDWHMAIECVDAAVLEDRVRRLTEYPLKRAQDEMRRRRLVLEQLPVTIRSVLAPS